MGVLPTLGGTDWSAVTGPTDFADYTNILKLLLQRLCAALNKPLVLLFDEVDCLAEGTLITFLRQLRDGCVNRAGGTPFPSSVALVGMRNIRDYKAQVRPGGTTLGSASPFNIAAKSLTLANFTEDEVASLYAQHTSETGQAFPPESVARAFYWSQGQPWLANALAHEVIDEILGMDYGKSISTELFDEAAERLILRRDTHLDSLSERLILRRETHLDSLSERLILRRDTHLDSLSERLREPRVRRIVEPVLLGEDRAFDLLGDDCRYVFDRRPGRTWDERIFWRTVESGGRTIHIVGA